MKKIFFLSLLLFTFFAGFGQTNTGTLKTGKLRLDTPDRTTDTLTQVVVRDSISKVTKVTSRNEFLKDVAKKADLNLKANTDSPNFTGTVSGITKSMVGLSNVDNTSDSNKPISTATQTAIDNKINLSEKAAVNGVATLGADGKVPNSQIPALAISETFPVASQAAMLGLNSTGQGDVAVRTDISKSFILTQSPASTLSNWQELLTPTDAVQSVDGQVGNVNLTTSYAPLSGSANYIQNQNASAQSANMWINGTGTFGDPSVLDGSTKLKVNGNIDVRVEDTVGGGYQSGILFKNNAGTSMASVIGDVDGYLYLNSNNSLGLTSQDSVDITSVANTNINSNAIVNITGAVGGVNINGGDTGVYVDALKVTGTTQTGDVFPLVANTTNIGSATTYFNNLYTQTGYINNVHSNVVTANSFVKNSGTSSQFLKADGSTSTISNPLTGVGSQLDSSTHAVQDGTILYHNVKWFTPTGAISVSGTTATSVGTQFTSGMVGAKLTINGEWRIITAYTSSTVVTVSSAYSTNYSGVAAGSWGVYKKAVSLNSNGTITIDGGQGVDFGADVGLYSFYSKNGGYKIGADGTVELANSGKINFANGGSYTNTKDTGLRRNAAGVLEVYDGVTADGAIGNRRDFLARNITGSLFNSNYFGYGASNITNNLAIKATMPSITTAEYTYAIGNGAAQNLSTGWDNVFVGDSSGNTIVNSMGNTGVGKGTLSKLASGSNNTAFGNYAGAFLTTDYNSTPFTSTGSIFIGYFTKPLADNQSNQIVIGNNTVGLGSNSTVLGNSSTTKTAIYGKTLINTATDNGSAVEKLQVNGSAGFNGGLMLREDGASITGYDATGVTATGNVLFNKYTGVSLSSSNTNPIKFNVNGTESGRFIGGNLLLGSTTDNATDRLQVTGNTYTSGDIKVDGDIEYKRGAYRNTLGWVTSTTDNVINFPNASGTVALKEDVKPYKVYTALLSQTGTSAPVATVLENTLGGTVVWSRTGVGEYIATLSGVFTPEKTLNFISYADDHRDSSFGWNDVDTCFLTQYRIANSGDPIYSKADGMYHTSIEIRVYN